MLSLCALTLPLHGDLKIGFMPYLGPGAKKPMGAPRGVKLSSGVEYLNSRIAKMYPRECYRLNTLICRGCLLCVAVSNAVLRLFTAVYNVILVVIVLMTCLDSCELKHVQSTSTRTTLMASGLERSQMSIVPKVGSDSIFHS